VRRRQISRVRIGSYVLAGSRRATFVVPRTLPARSDPFQRRGFSNPPTDRLRKVRTGFSKLVFGRCFHLFVGATRRTTRKGVGFRRGCAEVRELVGPAIS
jgi:hypothetical protein